MENKKSFLNLSHVKISNINIRIPNVGEILDDEQHYYKLVHSLTASPFQYMVQLDDMGIDYTSISDYELFLLLFQSYNDTDISILSHDLNSDDFKVIINPENNTPILFSSKLDLVIDELVYVNLVNTIRKINLIKKVNSKPGNEEAKRYLLEKERRKQKRNAKKPYSPYLEKLVIALVNRSEFKYNYEEVMDISIYKFNQSFEQIQTTINFENTMQGVYFGTIDTSKLKDKSCLSWIPVS